MAVLQKRLNCSHCEGYDLAGWSCARASLTAHRTGRSIGPTGWAVSEYRSRR
jgi:hypothetical protein